MRDETGFLKTILDDPDDDTHRLVYADWLEEHGEPERAAFVRLQLECDRLARGIHCWMTGTGGLLSE